MELLWATPHSWAPPPTGLAGRDRLRALSTQRGSVAGGRARVVVMVGLAEGGGLLPLGVWAICWVWSAGRPDRSGLDIQLDHDVPSFGRQGIQVKRGY